MIELEFELSRILMKQNFVSCFDIGEVPRSPGRWNWNWLYFLPFIFTFEQGDCYHLLSGTQKLSHLGLGFFLQENEGIRSRHTNTGKGAHGVSRKSTQ